MNPWWRRIRAWLTRQHQLVDALITTEHACRQYRKALGDLDAVHRVDVADLQQQLLLARQEAERADALRVDALRTAEDRTRLVGVYHGRLNRIHALTDVMPDDVAARVRVYTRPEEAHR